MLRTLNPIPAFYLAVLFSLLSIPFSRLPAGETAEETPLAVQNIKIELKDGRITLQARNADFEKVLKVLTQKAGLQLSLYEDLQGTVTVDWQDLPLEECFKKLIPNYGFLYKKSPDGSARLAAVAAFKSRQPLDLKNLPPARGQRIATLAYGTKPGEIGRVNLPEVERQGPESFAVDDPGNFYLCDTVNRKLKIISPQGKLIQDLTVPGNANDVMVTENGDVFILDEIAGALFRYGSAGRLLNQISVPSPLILRKNSIRSFGQSIILETRDQEEMEIGKMEGGKLIPGRPDSKPATGRKGRDGLLYQAKKISPERGEITMTDDKGDVVKKIGLPLPGLASIVILGEDADSNLYLQIEKSRGNALGVALLVLKLDKNGNVIASTGKIPNNYHSWTARLLQVTGRGDIYQMLPAAERVELNRYRIQ